MSLRYEKDGTIAIFTLENGSVNPTTPAMHKELFLSLRDFLTDDHIHCGILTGAGERAFSAGDDIRTPNRVGKGSNKEQVADHMWRHREEGEIPDTFAWSRDVLAMDRFKPIIGAVHGWCLGQGLIYLLSLTDIRIASTTAKFGFPEIAYGMGGAGGMARLATQLPYTTAMWMLLTGEAMSADEALSHRLINKVVQPENLMTEARGVAERIAHHPALAVRVEMEAFIRSRELPKADALAFTDHIYRLQRLALQEDIPKGHDFLYRSAKPQ